MCAQKKKEGVLTRKNRGRHCGQTILETAILLVAIILAFMVMQVYLRRGVQGRLRQDIDAIGGQYDPRDTVSDYTINHISNTTSTTTTSDGLVMNPYSGEMENRLLTTVVSRTHYDNTFKTGNETVGNFID